MKHARRPLVLVWGLLPLLGCDHASKTDGAGVPVPTPAEVLTGPGRASPAPRPPRGSPRVSTLPRATPDEEYARCGRAAILEVLVVEQQCIIGDLRALLDQVDRDEDAYHRAWKAGRLPPGAFARDQPAFGRARARYDAELDKAGAELSRLRALLDELERPRPEPRG